MRIAFFTAAILAVSLRMAAQVSCASSFWPESSYTVEEFRGISFGSALNFAGQQQELKMDIYRPADAGIAPRPLMVWLYGGGFIGGERAHVEWPCKDFCERGFVTAAPDYRLGWEVDFSDLCKSNGASVYPAMHRAVQDVRAALRYLVHFADSFGIDTSLIFIGGYSAGAILSLQVPWQQEAETDTALVAALGALDASGNSFTENFSIKASVSYAGALTDVRLMNSGEKIPFLAFHGTCDDIVYFGHGPIFSCEDLPWYDGPEVLAAKADSLGMCYRLQAWCGGDHNLGYYEYPSRDIAFLYLLENFVCGTCASPEQIPVWDKENGACSQIPLCRFSQDSLPFRFRIGPNPNSGTFSLYSETEQPVLFSIQLHDVHGAEVFRSDFNYLENSEAMQITIPNAATGLYLLRIRSGNAEWKSRIEIFK